MEPKASEACIDEEIKSLEKILEDNSVDTAEKKYSKGARFFKVDN